ncbi:MAG: tRNA pseudouridine(55) synthase TruB [Kaiparowitsia implicata GSE-PSE-MK54-09C]|nr:tRNA pseudouridine(55) synthase TruB [Kaiparowitsia implicata GSE-PSE-MK54-09C]
MDGFLNLNKPLGLTSHDCVARLRRLLRIKRVGHAGTLDPAATGVLPIAVGRATRLLQFLPTDKAYHAVVRFGVQTDTDDLDGEVLRQQPALALSLEAVESALPQFVGMIQQVPPRYSAIQVGGKRLYELARAGLVVDVPIRTVTIHQIEVQGWRSGDFPEMDLAIACGSGTYIRAIARDLGDVLGTGATLAALERTVSSGFALAHSHTLEALETLTQDDALRLIQPQAVLAHLAALTLSPQLAQRWCQGQRLPLVEIQDTTSLTTGSRDVDPPRADSSNDEPQSDRPYCVNHANGDFLGVGRLIEAQSVLSPWVVWN